MKNLFAIFLCVISVFSYAKNTNSGGSYEISEITWWSLDESIYPQYKGTIQLKLSTPIQWSGDGDCHDSDVFIRNKDAHLISAALAAHTTNTSIKINADDALKIGPYCFVRTLTY